MNNSFSFKIYSTINELPKNWDDFACDNIFLATPYLKVLQDSAPENMDCHFIALFKAEKLVGIALSQKICLTHVSSFGVNKSCFKSKLRSIVFRQFAANVLVIGNNMLTGQNAFYFSDEILFSDGLQLLEKAALQLKDKFKAKKQTIHIVTFKDFDVAEQDKFKIDAFASYHPFNIQPNMVFNIPENWLSADDYLSALSKKYRDQYKRSHKKLEGVEKRKLSLEEIIFHNDKIYELYLNVTKNAPFNTFYLHKDHFIAFKKNLEHNFLFYAYFIDNEMIGFNTLIKNGTVIDTYFLGYDDNYQRDKMLYLNMLYDMVGYSINKKFKKIVFARTALEIKSSVGAKPQDMFGIIKHTNKIINIFMPRLFKFFEPEAHWIERNPFK